MNAEQNAPGPGSADGPGTVRRGGRWVPSRTRTLAVVLVAALLVPVVRLTVVQTVVVPSESMTPTLRAGDRLLVARTGDVRRGDVVVFDGTDVFDFSVERTDTSLARLGRAVASALGAPVAEHDYVKRVIGLPGEHVVCCDAEGRITVDDVPLDETYLADGTVPSTVAFDVTVPADRLFVLGDARATSEDSRSHLGDPGGGMVPEDRVVGRVAAVWWPWSRAGGVDREDPATGDAR